MRNRQRGRAGRDAGAGWALEALRRERLRTTPRTVLLAVASGVLGTSAIAAFLFAIREQSLSIAVVDLAPCTRQRGVRRTTGYWRSDFFWYFA